MKGGRCTNERQIRAERDGWKAEGKFGAHKRAGCRRGGLGERSLDLLSLVIRLLSSIFAFRLPSFGFFLWFFCFCFLFFCSALRVPPAETRLTVYRRLNIEQKMFSSKSNTGSEAICL